MVGLFGLEINTASFTMYTFSLAVLVQALTLVSFSALADYGMLGRSARWVEVDWSRK